MLDALHREAQRFPGRKDDIEAEIRNIERLPRPATSPEDPVTVIDPRVEYIRSLERELGRSDRSRHSEIETEIARAKAELRSSGTSRAVASGGNENTAGPVARRGRPRKNESAGTEDGDALDENLEEEN